MLENLQFAWDFGKLGQEEKQMCKVVKNGKTHTEDIYSAKFFLTLRDSQGHHIEYETHHLLLQNTVQQ